MARNLVKEFQTQMRASERARLQRKALFERMHAALLEAKDLQAQGKTAQARKRLEKAERLKVKWEKL